MSSAFTANRCIYVGEFQHSIDAKKRLTVPSKWRFSGDQEDVYLALPNPVGCITIYPPKMVAKLEEKVAEVSLADKKGQQALAKLFSQADTFGCDKQGRIVLSDKLAAHAGIQKETTLAGNFATFNIWEPSAYKRYMESEQDQDDPMSEILRDLGL